MRFILRHVFGGLATFALLQGSRASKFIRNCTGEGRFALTFEDGPDPKNTPAILDVLKEFNITATFFFLEDKISASNEAAEIVKRAYNEGHVIGSKVPKSSNEPYMVLRSLDFLYMSLLDGRYPTNVRVAPEILHNNTNEKFSDNRNIILFDLDLANPTDESITPSPIARLYDSQFENMDELRDMLTATLEEFTFINVEQCFESSYPTFYNLEEKKKAYSRNYLPWHCIQPGTWHFIFDRIKDPVRATDVLDALHAKNIKSTFFVDKSILKNKKMKQVLNRTLTESHLLVPVLTTSFDHFKKAVAELNELDKYFNEHFNQIPKLLALLEPEITDEGDNEITKREKVVINWQEIFTPEDKFEDKLKEFNPKFDSPISAVEDKTFPDFKKVCNSIELLKTSGFHLVNFNQCTMIDSFYKTVPSKEEQKRAEKEAAEVAKQRAKLEAKEIKETKTLVDEAQVSKAGKKKESFLRQFFPHKENQIKSDE